MRINPEYEIAWEKLRLPDEKEDDFEEDEGYNDEPKFMALSQIISPGMQNPFYQLKTFDFWTGHTNFKLTKAIVVIINSVLGVESLEVVSPYRFHFSVGKRFSSGEVMQEISSQVIEYLNKYEKKRRH